MNRRSVSAVKYSRMSPLVLDTSLLVDYIRRKDKESSPFLILMRQGYDPYISIVTHTELYSGKSVWERESAREELAILFSNIEIILLDPAISMVAGKIVVVHGAEMIDAIIAASALSRGFPLATLNRKDFLGIEKLELMQL